jgi:AAA domain/UvrD-like helicase C-terminal domain
VATARQQVQSADAVICANIDALPDQRALLSQNVLAQLRNLVEATALWLHEDDPEAAFDFEKIKPAIRHARATARYRFLGQFHGWLQQIASHYTHDGETSERLMLKYFEYLLRTRNLLAHECGIQVLHNLESFPVDLDPALARYHEQIAAAIEHDRATAPADGPTDRYYIHNTRPFFVGNRIFYEVTISRANNRSSKTDRFVAFTSIDVADYYSANLTLRTGTIEVFDQQLPVTLIARWEVSIRPCEFDNFARLVGHRTKVRTNSPEYQKLMAILTARASSLLDIVTLPASDYERVRRATTARVRTAQIFPALDVARGIIEADAPGANLLRYLLLRMRNRILRLQYDARGCHRLSGLCVSYRCIPFDKMPFCTSPPGHNPHFRDLLASINVSDRQHELLARRVTTNVERHGMLYTPMSDLETFEDIEHLISEYNRRLYSGHPHRRLEQDKGHVFLRGYEDKTVTIVRELQRLASVGRGSHERAVTEWLDRTSYVIDDELKAEALRKLFVSSRVGAVYGAAGTGKSTFINHIANHFEHGRKLFLAHTNPAVENLQRRVSAENSEFRTLARQRWASNSTETYELLVIDECSTVSNDDMVEVLQRTNFEYLVLVGDVFQIEAIQFGNWFSIIRDFLPGNAVFELTTPYRTTNDALIGLWGKVRSLDDDVAEALARGSYSAPLDESVLVRSHEDEVTLCLNYDGLYGINNINRFLQTSNPSPPVHWRGSTFKVDDPVLFNENERFRPLIHNNMKGRIAGIERSTGQIQFDIELDRTIKDADVFGLDLVRVDDRTVQFSVVEIDDSDEDTDALTTVVPFHVAYAVSIHKAQGLEYESVKVVVTDANEESITHSVFYTAITRPRERLKVHWSPETQHAVLTTLTRRVHGKDVALLAQRHGLTPNYAAGRRS